MQGRWGLATAAPLGWLGPVCAAAAPGCPPRRALAARLPHRLNLSRPLPGRPPRPPQVALGSFDRCPDDEAWDAQLSALLAFKAEHGNCQLGEAAPRWAPLAAWLAAQHAELAAGRLLPQRAAQLAAIGAITVPGAPQQQRAQPAAAPQPAAA